MFRLIATFLTILSMMSSASALAAEPSDAGVKAYRAGEYDRAWSLLNIAAEAGDLRAKRYLGKLVLAGGASDPKSRDLEFGVSLLTEAALEGDYAALISLEDLRRSGLAHAPSLGDMIVIEKAMASKGDPVTAWRLANRYRDGDGVAARLDEEVRWLTVAAQADPAEFPLTGDAAFRICASQAETASGAAIIGDANYWCQQAAEQGHPAATILLRRLASLPG